MTHTPSTWRPAGASDHPGWEVISRAILAIANRTARLSATYIEAEQEAIRAVNEWLEEQKITPEESPPKTAPNAMREAIAEIFYEVMPYDMDGAAFMGKPDWEPGRNSPRQNEARAYADRALTIFTPAPSPDAILPCDVHLPVNTYIKKGCTVESLMTAISKREGFPHDATVFAVPSPDGAGEEARHLADWMIGYLENECGLICGEVSSGDRTNVVNAILNSLTAVRGGVSPDLLQAARDMIASPGIDKIRVKSQGSQLLSRDEVFLRIIEARSALTPSPTGAAEPDGVRACTCNPSDDPPVPCAQKYALSECKAADAALWALISTLHENVDPEKQPKGWCDFSDAQINRLKRGADVFLRLSAPAVRDEQHVARFLARLIYRRGVAYGKGLESEDAWVAANWRFFLGDARLLGGVASAARPSIEQLCVAIADGYNNGNQQYEKCDAFARMRFHAAAESVSRLFAPAVWATTRKKRAEQIQSILAETLAIQDGEIIGTGPASYKIADALSTAAGVEQP